MHHTRIPIVRPLLAALLALAGGFLLAAALRQGLLAAGTPTALAEGAARIAAAVALALGMTARFGRAASGFGHRIGTWAPAAWRPGLVMATIVAVNLVTDDVDWSALELTAERASRWLMNAAASGLFEEVLVRGTVFVLLARAWGTSRRGLQAAAVTQAVLFGAMHLTNLSRSDTVYVLYQCCFATFIGYGFAGLFAYTRSLWPAVILHAGANAAGGIDWYFASPAYAFPELTRSTMAVVLLVFFVCGAVPGAWCLRRTTLPYTRPLQPGNKTRGGRS